MTYGVIDVGSNTIRLCIYQVTDGKVQVLFNNKNTAGLYGYVEDGKLSEKGIKKACEVLNSHKRMAERINIEDLFVFATASLRNISNTEEALAEIYDQTGLNVDVLTGYEEATLDFEGAAHAMELDKGIMVDIGGGSTELLVYDRGAIQDAVSLPVGSLYMYKNHVTKLFPKRKEEKDIRDEVREHLHKVKFLKNQKYSTVLGIGGSIRAVKKFNNNMLSLPKSNDKFSTESLSDVLYELHDSEKATLDKILKVSADRVHTLIPGLLILQTICQYCKCEEIMASNFGVREGYLYKKVVESHE